jgi:hypothetical protein
MRNYCARLVNAMRSSLSSRGKRVARSVSLSRAPGDSTSTTITGLWHCEDYFASTATVSSDRAGTQPR